MKPIVIIVVYLGSLLANTSSFAECTTNRNSSITITKPDGLYVDHADGTVTDKQTGLMWQKCSLGQTGGACSSGSIQLFTWQAAIAAANENADYGYTDWRLPNTKELESLIEIACSSPAINETVFPNTGAGGYWSSSPHAGFGSAAWYVYFFDGSVSRADKGFEEVRGVRGRFVRLVRGGQ
jgi:hypothetical protein